MMDNKIIARLTGKCYNEGETIILVSVVQEFSGMDALEASYTPAAAYDVFGEEYMTIKMPPGGREDIESVSCQIEIWAPASMTWEAYRRPFYGRYTAPLLVGAV